MAVWYGVVDTTLRTKMLSPVIVTMNPMIQPERSGSAFLDDVRAARSRPEPFHIWWLGQSGFLLQTDGRHLLFDPYLSDSLTRKYAGTEKPHVRMTERVIAPEKLDFIDVVTSTHNHTDHLDAETLGPLMEVNEGLPLIIPEANRAFAANRLDCDPAYPIGLVDGASATVAGFEFAAVPAAHEDLETDEEGRHTHLGYVVTFDGWTVYFSGDTVRYDGMVERLDPFDIDVCILPINGSDPSRGVPGNFSGPEAAQLAKDLGAGVAIPCHYEMFEFNTSSPEPFFEAGRQIGQRAVRLQSGGRWSCDL